MIKLEVTQKSFDTILAALWFVKLHASAASSHGLNSTVYVDLTNLMANIGNQRDTQVREEALSELREAEAQ